MSFLAPIQPSLDCKMHGVHRNFLDLSPILRSQKKKDPASNFTMLPGRLQPLIQDRCLRERQGRASRGPQAVTIPSVAPPPTCSYPPPIHRTGEKEGCVAPHVCSSIHDPCITAYSRLLIFGDTVEILNLKSTFGQSASILPSWGYNTPILFRELPFPCNVWLGRSVSQYSLIYLPQGEIQAGPVRL